MNTLSRLLARGAAPLALAGAASLLASCAISGLGEPRPEDWTQAEVATARGDWDLAAGLWSRLRHATYDETPRPHLETAHAMVQLGQSEDALALLDRAVELFPGDPALLAARGRLLASMGFRRAASVDLEEALEGAPTDPAAWASLGLIQLELEQPHKAAISLDRAIALDTAASAEGGDGSSGADGSWGGDAGAWGGGMDRARAYQLAARAHRDLGELDRAHELYRTAVALSRAASPDGEASVELLVEGASLHSDHTDNDPTCPRLEVALGWIRAALAIDPQAARAAFVHGCLLERRGSLEEAVLAYRRAIEIDNLHLGALTNLALIHARLGEDKRCAAMVARALALEVDERRRAALAQLIQP